MCYYAGNNQDISTGALGPLKATDTQRLCDSATAPTHRRRVDREPDKRGARGSERRRRAREQLPLNTAHPDSTSVVVSEPEPFALDESALARPGEMLRWWGQREVHMVRSFPHPRRVKPLLHG